MSSSGGQTGGGGGEHPNLAEHDLLGLVTDTILDDAVGAIETTVDALPTLVETQALADAAQAAAEAAAALDVAGHEALASPHSGHTTDVEFVAHTGAFSNTHGRVSAIKSASTVAPNNTLAADPHLFVDLAVGTHAITGWLLVRGAVTDDFQAELRFADAPNGSGRWSLSGPTTAVVVREGDATFAATSIGAANPLSCGTGGTGSGGEIAVRIEATVTAATAQRLTLWWAPVANVATTEVRVSSRMRAERLL